MSTKRIFYMKAFNLVLTGLLLGIIVWLLVTLILGVIYQPEYSNDIKVTVNFNNKPVEGTETVETTRQVPVTCPFSGETKTSEVKTVVKTTKAEPSERRVVITEDTFKETMQQVAYTAHQQAKSEYDKNFTTLLTILTIFGIAWPVIIALLQFKFNENELNKIKKARKDARTALRNGQQLIDKNRETKEKIEKLTNEFNHRNNVLWCTIGLILEAQCLQYISLPNHNIDVIRKLKIISLLVTMWKYFTTSNHYVLEYTDICSIEFVLNDFTCETEICDNSNANLNQLLGFKNWLCQCKANNTDGSEKLQEVKIKICSIIDNYKKLLNINDITPQ